MMAPSFQIHWEPPTKHHKRRFGERTSWMCTTLVNVTWTNLTATQFGLVWIYAQNDVVLGTVRRLFWTLLLFLVSQWSFWDSMFCSLPRYITRGSDTEHLHLMFSFWMIYLWFTLWPTSYSCYTCAMYLLFLLNHCCMFSWTRKIQYRYCTQNI